MNVSSKAGRYELQQELGRGSMGVVYRAHDPVIGRTVAVKTVRLADEGSGLSHDELLTRFQTEARAAGLLAHPNIVVVYDAGEEDGLFYITMELVEGRSLQQLMNRRQNIPLPQVMRWMEQACSALEFAHQHSVVHRDIKPANLMLTADDTLKITDFGTAKILQLGATQTAHVIGTPSYMSPEQIKGKPVDGRSDVFSLGVVLYELLTGAKPFHGDSVTTVIYKIVNEDPVPPRELDASIPAGLSAVVNRALAKSPWARFQSCREFSEALHNYQDFDERKSARPGPAATASAPLPRSAPVVTQHIPSSVPSMAHAAAARRQRGSFWVVLVLLTIIGAAGYRAWPALQEIWQRSQSPAGFRFAPAQTAPPTAREEVLSPLPMPPPPMPDRANAISAAPEETQQAASPTSPAVPTIPANAVIRKPSTPAISPAAAEWKDRIEQAIVDSNAADRVRVLAAGNTLTLTGKLDPAAHRQLLGRLQSTPTSLQIIDDIEYSAEPAGDSTPVNEQ